MTPNRIQSCNSSDNRNQESEFSLIQSMRNISDLVGSLDIAGSFIEKINNIYPFASNGTIAVAPEKDGWDAKSGNECTSAFSKEPARQKEHDAAHSHHDTMPKLKHSHSQSCMTECRQTHHAISSWRHSLSVHRSHVPHKLQEPFIEYGYLLPFMPWRYYLRALYMPSYELMNVWTHLFPALYFIYLLYQFSQEMDIIVAWPLFLITFSGIMLGIFSAMAHLFHAKSSLHHSCWFVADYFGISLYAFSSLTTNFYSGSQSNYYKMLSSNYLHITIVIAIVGFTCLCITQTNQKWISTSVSRQVKVYVNGFGYAFGALPLFQRMYGNFFTGEVELSLQYHALAIFCMLVAPIVYGMDLPQRLHPGRFDVFGHSHMWFHLFTASSMWFSINAVYFDVLDGPWKKISQEADYPALSEVVFYYCILILYGFFCGHITHCSVKCDYPNEEPFLQGKLLCACGLPETMKVHPTSHIARSKTMASIREWKIEEEFH